MPEIKMLKCERRKFSVTCAEFFLTIALIVTIVAGSVLAFNSMATSDYISGIIRARDNIAAHYGANPDFSDLNLTTAMKFTKVPDLGISSGGIQISPYIAAEQTSGFLIRLNKRDEKNCIDYAAMLRSHFDKITVNGNPVQKPRDVILGCKNEQNTIDLITYSKQITDNK